jgi:hypothetical protein
MDDCLGEFFNLRRIASHKFKKTVSVGFFLFGFRDFLFCGGKPFL